MSLFQEFVLNDPPTSPSVAVVAVPSSTTIGRQIMDKLMDLTKAVEFTKCVPQFLPDILLGEDDGKPYILGLDLYKSTRGKPSLLMVTSNFQVGLSPAPYSYWMAEYIVRKARQVNSSRLVVLDSVSREKAGRQGMFYIASDKHSAEWAKSIKLRPLPPGVVRGFSSLLVSACRLYKFQSLGIISALNDGARTTSFVNAGMSALVRSVDLQIP